jgi:hypothetical protein
MTTVIGGSSPSVTFPDSTVQNTAGLPLTGGTLSGPVNVPTLNAPSGVLATQNGMTGIAKAWAQFNYSGTIQGSFNVSSITTNATGDYSLNFTTAMTNSNYAVTLGAPSGAPLAVDGRQTAMAVMNTAYSTSYVRVTCYNTVSGVAANAVYMNVVVFGA